MVNSHCLVKLSSKLCSNKTVQQELAGVLEQQKQSEFTIKTLQRECTVQKAQLNKVESQTRKIKRANAG